MFGCSWQSAGVARQLAAIESFPQATAGDASGVREGVQACGVRACIRSVPPLVPHGGSTGVFCRWDAPTAHSYFYKVGIRQSGKVRWEPPPHSGAVCSITSVLVKGDVPSAVAA